MDIQDYVGTSPVSVSHGTRIARRVLLLHETDEIREAAPGKDPRARLWAPRSLGG